MLRPILAFSVLSTAVAAQVSFVHLGTVDVSTTSTTSNPEFVGTNPSAVAWNGTTLWVAGFYNLGTPGTTAICRIDNPLSPTPTFNAAFGVLPTPGLRGYSGLDVSGGLLVAAWDSGTSAPEGIRAYDLAGNQLWQKDARGSSGVGIDPGFPGLGGDGVGWTTIGSGRRALQDATTGADVYTLAAGPNAGMIVQPAGLNTTIWRDMDFDSFSGDIYLRKENQLIGGLRIGPNDVINMTEIVPVTPGQFINIQNVAFVRQAAQQFCVWNDRSVGTGNQPFEDVIRATRPDGTELTIDYGTFIAPAGVGAYDFSYDAASSTLAIVDFAAREVHSFAVSSFVEYGTGCPGAGGVFPRLTGSGDTRPNGAITYTVIDAAPLSIGLFAFGNSMTSVPLPFPAACPLHVTPVVLLAGAFVTGPGAPGTGTGSVVVPVPPGTSGAVLTCQGVMLEGGSLATVRTTNGVEVTVQ